MWICSFISTWRSVDKDTTGMNANARNSRNKQIVQKIKLRVLWFVPSLWNSDKNITSMKTNTRIHARINIDTLKNNTETKVRNQIPLKIHTQLFLHIYIRTFHKGRYSRWPPELARGNKYKENKTWKLRKISKILKGK